MTEVVWEKVIFYGDSLTQRGYSPDGCWVALLADKLQRKCDVVSRGFSGYNSLFCRVMLPRIITDKDASSIASIFIFLGANDSNRADLSPQCVPLKDYHANLVAMVEYLVSVGIDRKKIVLIGPPPCEESAWKVVCEMRGFIFGKDNALVSTYSEACRSAAAALGVEFVELYHTMMAVKNWPSLLCDGLHFSTRGSEMLAELLWPVVDKRTADIAMKLPLWNDIDPKHPEEALLK